MNMPLDNRSLLSELDKLESQPHRAPSLSVSSYDLALIEAAIRDARPVRRDRQADDSTDVFSEPPVEPRRTRRAVSFAAALLGSAAVASAAYYGLKTDGSPSEAAVSADAPAPVSVAAPAAGDSSLAPSIEAPAVKTSAGRETSETDPGLRAGQEAASPVPAAPSAQSADVTETDAAERRAFAIDPAPALPLPVSAPSANASAPAAAAETASAAPAGSPAPLSARSFTPHSPPSAPAVAAKAKPAQARIIHPPKKTAETGKPAVAKAIKSPVVKPKAHAGAPRQIVPQNDAALPAAAEPDPDLTPDNGGGLIGKAQRAVGSMTGAVKNLVGLGQR